MSYLPITFREDNFPPTNFRKLAANRNKKLYLLYLFITRVKNVFARLFRNLRKRGTGTRQDALCRERQESRPEEQDREIFVTHG